jgi:hypothetical protein
MICTCQKAGRTFWEYSPTLVQATTLLLVALDSS